jgi:hypothetical protein
MQTRDHTSNTGHPVEVTMTLSYVTEHVRWVAQIRSKRAPRRRAFYKYMGIASLVAAIGKLAIIIWHSPARWL